MAYLSETSEFDANVWRLASTDPLLGCFGEQPSQLGELNFAQQALANRTRYLKDHLDGIQAQLMVADASALRLVAIGSGMTIAQTLGAVTAGDGGSGMWRWDATSTATDNTGTVIKPSGYSGAGRWLREHSGIINIQWFGATDGDYSQAFERAIEAGSIVYIPTGIFPVSRGIVVPANRILTGDGVGSIVRVESDVFAFQTQTGADSIRFENFNISAEHYVSGEAGGIYATGSHGGSIALGATNICVEHMVFENLGKPAVLFSNARNSYVLKNIFYLCANDIVLKSQCLNVTIDSNSGEGLGNLGIDYRTGVFIDIYATLKSDGSRPSDFSLYNLPTDPTDNRHLDNPEGIIITNNHCVGYGVGVILDNVLAPVCNNNVIDTCYDHVVKIRGCFKTVVLSNWFAIHPTVLSTTSRSILIEHSQHFNIQSNLVNYTNQGIEVLSSNQGNFDANIVEFTGTEDAGVFLADAASAQLGVLSNLFYSNIANTVDIAANDFRCVVNRNKLLGGTGGTVHIPGLNVDNSHNSWNNTKGINPGCTSHPGGIRTMWGKTDFVSIPANSSSLVEVDFSDLNLPIFQSDPFNLQLTVGGNGLGSVGAISLSVSGFTAVLNNNYELAQNFFIYWFVTGRDTV